MSLTDCLKKAKLSKEAAAEVKKAAKKYERSGMDRLEAERAAILDAIDEAMGQLDELRGDNQPVAIDAPAPKQEAAPRQEFEQAGDIKQGATVFTPDFAVIKLMAADRSTLIHESSHVWLEYLFKLAKSGNDTIETAHHWSKIKEFLDIKDDQEKLTTAQQEKWARSFEGYLLEGRAPNTYLKRAFRNFAKWLVEIYKNLRGLSDQAGFEVKISEDAREIFDRLLSTEQELALANEARGASLGVIDTEQLAPAVKKRLDDLRERASGEAFDELVRVQMAELSKEHKEKLAAARDAREPEVRKEVEAEPIYQTIAQVAEAFGRSAKTVSEDFLAGKLKEDDAAALELFAGFAGFSSADHLANVVIKTESVEYAVRQRLNAEQEPNIMDTGEIRQLAEEAVRSNQSLELLALEAAIFEDYVNAAASKHEEKMLEAMARNDEKAVKREQERLLKEWLDAKEKHKERTAYEKGKAEGDAKLKKRDEKDYAKMWLAAERKLLEDWLAAKDKAERDKLVAAYKEQQRFERERYFRAAKDAALAAPLKARELLNAMSVKEAGSFRRYYTSERNAAVKVAKAIKDQDYDAAATYKRQQMLAHAMAIESQKIRRQAEKNLRYLEKAAKIDRAKLGKQEHYEQLAKLLNRFGFAVSGFDPSIEAYPQSLRDWEKSVDPDGSSINIADWLYSETITKDANDLTPDQLHDLREAVENIRHFAKAEQELTHFADKITMVDAEARLIEAVKKTQPNANKRGPGDKTRYQRIKSTARRYSLALTGVDRIFERLGGTNREQNPFFTIIGKKFYDGAQKKHQLLDKTKEVRKAVFKEYTKKEIKELVRKPIFIEELGVSMPRIWIMSLARNLGNQSSRDVLFSSAPVGVYSDWNEAIAMQVFTKYLSARDWRAVQNAIDAAESLGVDAFDFHKQQTGFAPRKIEALPFTVVSKDGEVVQMRGGYYPLAADRRDTSRAGQATDLSADLEQPLYEQVGAWKVATKQGYLKGRVKGAKYAVHGAEFVLSKHIEETAHDIAYREPVRVTQALLARPAVKTAIVEHHGEEIYNALVENVKGMALGYRSPKQGNIYVDLLNDVAQKIGAHAVSSFLMLKVRPVVQNFANFALVPYGQTRNWGWKETIFALVKNGAFGFWGENMRFSRAAKERMAKISEKSAMMAKRLNNPDYSLYDQQAEQLMGKSASDQAIAAGGSMLAWTENFIAVPCWEYSYEQELSRNGGDDAGAVKFADELIGKALGNPERFRVAPAVRARGLGKLFAPFFSFMSTYRALWGSQAQMRSEGEISNARFVGFMAAQMLLFVPISALLTGHWPGDGEDEPQPDQDDVTKWMKWLATTNVENFAGMYPVIGTAIKYGMDNVIGNTTHASLRITPLESATDIYQRVLKAATADREKDGYLQGLAEAGAKAASFTAPFPDQINIWAFNLYDVFANQSDPRWADLVKRRKKDERGQ